jgi:hypothetical protein
MTNFEVKQTTDITGATIDYVIKTDEDGKIWTIPNDPSNSDYQAYLRWLENPEAEQSTPSL